MPARRRPSNEGSFRRLESLLKKAGLNVGNIHENAPSEPLKPKSQPERLPEPESEEEIFRREMESVKKADWKHTLISSAPPVRNSGGVPQESKDLELMKAALAGDPALAITDHPEYIEGWIGVDGKRYIPNLRNGLYSIQGYLDLHGLTCEEARQEVEDFLLRVSRFQPCCVKIIHGRGLNSPSDKAILKESLQRWLCTRKLARRVLAFASAALLDGGVGATYVLLRCP